MSNRESKAGESLIEPLTRREREVLALLAQGYSGPEIAEKLTLALSSVKWHIQQLYGKLGVNSKQRAILRAGELGLLETISPSASAPERQPSASVHPGPKHNLPLQLTSFIGREKEIAAVKGLITSRSGVRLLTLTGAGGSGKTRLALQVAAELLGAFPAGVWLIELAPLSDPALVPQTVVMTLGLREEAGRSALAIVADFLQPKRALLVIDNCEHLIQACAQLAETLLRACLTLHILATSREALGIAGETPYLVPTLTTPDPAHPTLETLPQYEAVRLFVERAQTAMPSFRLTNANASAIVQVCQRLDGLPLAIELAAARVKTLQVEQIAARLEDRFRLLTGGNRIALLRHQTLRASIDWSYALLSGPEQILLRRLSAFADGWTLEAAEAVGGGEGIESAEVLDGLTQLANKSVAIVEREQGQETHYRMLETLRQYAQEKLLEANEAEIVRDRHLGYFLKLAEQAELELTGPNQVAWLHRLERELDNLRAALEWRLAQAERGDESLRLAGALLSFWRQRGHISEGRAWLARALASQAASSAGAARAKALHAAGYLARVQGDTTAARALLEESLSLWRALGPAGKTGLAHALATLGEVIRRLGDPATARSLAGEAIAIFREADERWGLAYALSNLGLAIRDQDDYALARSVINESVALWRDLGDHWGLRLATTALGDVALRQGDYEVAQRHYADCLAIDRKLGNEEGVAWSLFDLGIATLNLGDRIQAKTYFEEGFSLFRESGNKYGIAMSFYHFGLLALFEGDNQHARSFFEQELALARTAGPVWLGANALMGLAGAAAADGQARRAARLLGAADARLEAGASYWDAAESLYIERARASAVAQLGEAAFAAARAEGRAMTFEQAADYALEE